jgi:nondiscriminating glutamyl-tRNA synthetase
MDRIYRVAPSPTGYLHLGHTKPYLINYSLAKATKGKLILRIEDTDQKRNKMETVDNIIIDANWLGVEFDAGPTLHSEPNEYFQSTRLEIYQKLVRQLLAEGKAYKAYETPEERQMQIEEQRKKGQSPVYSGAHANLSEVEQQTFEKEGRKPVIRLRVPQNQIIEVDDEIYGKVKVNTNTIGDFVIQKSDGYPMYNFCVVVDDHLMNVTDVIRGFGHLSNTPKQILIYQTLGWELPRFAHFSDILNEDGKGKLSKRSGAKPISKCRAEGYLPDAIFNYVIVISSSFNFNSKEEEIMTREEILSSISIDKILKTNARFNSAKFDWFNGQHMRKFSPEEFYKKVVNWLENDAKLLGHFDESFETSLVDLFLSNTDLLKQTLPLIQTRIVKFSDIFNLLKFFFIAPDVSKIDFSNTKHEAEEVDKAAIELYNTLKELKTPWKQEDWEGQIRSLADELGWKHADVFMLLRLLIVGDKVSPPLLEAMQILGEVESLKRINK